MKSILTGVLALLYAFYLFSRRDAGLMIRAIAVAICGLILIAFGIPSNL